MYVHSVWYPSTSNKMTILWNVSSLLGLACFATDNGKIQFSSKPHTMPENIKAKHGFWGVNISTLNNLVTWYLPYNNPMIYKFTVLKSTVSLTSHLVTYLLAVEPCPLLSENPGITKLLLLLLFKFSWHSLRTCIPSSTLESGPDAWPDLNIPLFPAD